MTRQRRTNVTATVDDDRSEACTIRLGGFKKAGANSFLFMGGRPDELPHEIDIILWGKLSYHTHTALRTIIQQAPVTYTILKCYTSIVFVLFFICAFLELPSAQMEETALTTLLLMVYVPGLTFAGVKILDFCGCGTMKNFQHTHRTIVMTKMVQDKLKIPFQKAGFAINYDEHNGQMIIQKESSLDGNTAVELLESQTQFLVEAARTESNGAMELSGTDSISTPLLQETASMPMPPPMLPPSLYLYGDVQPTGMTTFQSGVFPASSEFDDDRHKEMVFGVIREVMAKKCSEIENSNAWLLFFGPCPFLVLVGVRARVGEGEWMMRIAIVNVQIKLYLMFVFAMYLTSRKILYRIFVLPKEIEACKRATTDSNLSQLVHKHFGYRLEYHVGKFDRWAAFPHHCFSSKVHYISFVPSGNVSSETVVL